MKIWITYDNCGQLHAGGLERCRVWFKQPLYFMSPLFPRLINENSPFEISEKEGLGSYGWVAGRDRGESASVSFGKVFGYSGGPEPGLNELAEFVWAKLKEHFNNEEPFAGWYRMEESKQSLARNFCLEIDLKIEMKDV